MPDDKKNIFYSPNYKPDRHYESDATFERTPQTKQTTEVIQPTPVTIKDEQDELLDNLTVLLDISDILPNSIRNIVKNITKTLIAVTIVKRNEEPESEEPESEEEEPESKEPDNYTKIDIQDNDIPEDEQLSIDDIFPQSTNIEVVTSQPKSLSKIISDIYAEDLLQLKQEYVSNMYLIIQHYIQEMLAAANNAGISYENLLMNYDGDAVQVSDANLKHLHDTIIRNQILITEEARQFSKTHDADNTLMIMRSLETAYQQRKKYYSEQYNQIY